MLEAIVIILESNKCLNNKAPIESYFLIRGFLFGHDVHFNLLK